LLYRYGMATCADLRRLADRLLIMIVNDSGRASLGEGLRRCPRSVPHSLGVAAVPTRWPLNDAKAVSTQSQTLLGNPITPR
jgi:hypothetical protein